MQLTCEFVGAVTTRVAATLLAADRVSCVAPPNLNAGRAAGGIAAVRVTNDLRLWSLASVEYKYTATLIEACYIAANAGIDGAQGQFTIAGSIKSFLITAVGEGTGQVTSGGDVFVASMEQTCSEDLASRCYSANGQYLPYMGTGLAVVDMDRSYREVASLLFDTGDASTLTAAEVNNQLASFPNNVGTYVGVFKTTVSGRYSMSVAAGDTQVGDRGLHSCNHPCGGSLLQLQANTCSSVFLHSDPRQSDHHRRPPVRDSAVELDRPRDIRAHDGACTTKEMMQPCLLYLEVISLMPQRQRFLLLAGRDHEHHPPADGRRLRQQSNGRLHQRVGGSGFDVVRAVHRHAAAEVHQPHARADALRAGLGGDRAIHADHHRLDGRRCGTPQHGLPSNKMALITSDSGATRCPEHRMALITSGCVPPSAHIVPTRWT